MINRSIRGLLLLLAVVLGYSASVQAQIKTTTFNDKTVKQNSIVVKISDEAVIVKGKAYSPKQMTATLRTQLNATIDRTIEAQGVEEWIVSGNMEDAISRLNRIPGVQAFPNYVFYRDEMEIGALPEGGISNQLNDVNAIPRQNPPANIGNSPVVSALASATFDPINVVWSDDLNDSLRVDSTYSIFNYSGTSEENWMLVDDGDGGFAFMAANTTDSVTEISTDVFTPSIDMSDWDTTKSYRLKIDIDNFYNSSAYIALYAVVNDEYVGDFVISNFDTFVWWDISALVGDTVTFNIWVDDSDVNPGSIFSFDNIEIEEYPTDDSYIELQYALYNDGLFNFGYSMPGADIDAFNAWEMTTGSDDVIMVVYDDGVDFDHPDLMENAWVNPGEIPGNGIDDDGNGYVDDVHGWSAIYDDNSYLNPGSFHGTHVAGILGAQGNNGIGVSGVAQDVSIINVMIFNEFGGTDAIAIMRGYQYISDLLDSGVEITGINQSWGGGGYLDLESDQQYVNVMTGFALDHAEHAALWVVSAGNSSSNRDDLPFYSYPNNIQSPNIITVASSDDADNLSGFSDFGEFTVDVSAPGSSIVSTLPPSTTGSAYGYLSGTSMASPQVSGILALAKAMYPNEDGFDLMTRVLAGNENVASLDGFTGAGGRVNAMGALDPTTLGASTPIAGGNTNQFHRTFVDGDAMETTGIVNTSDSDITVNSLTITGDNAANFYIMSDTDNLPTLAAGEAYGILVGFDNDGLVGDLSATLVVSTTAGDVNLGLIGHEQGFAFVEVSPDYENFGSVPYGDELNSSFTITNSGNAQMSFELFQALFFYDLEQSLLLDDKITFSPGPAPINKSGDNDDLEMINDITTKVMLERGDRQRPVINVNPAPNESADHTGPEIIWWDDLNDADSVDFYWDVLDFSDGVGDVWQLADFGADSVDNVFLFGDLDFGYLDNSATVAVTPTFDFSGYENDRGPAYLTFEVATALESFFDEFFLNIVVDGEPFAYIGGTETGEIMNNGDYTRVWIDITQFSGFENVEFWFIATSDISFAGGFGAMFDNVGIVVEDFPYFTSITEGELEAGASTTVDYTIRTGLLPAGDFVMFTDVYANGFISYYGNGGDFAGHVAEYSARNVALEIDPSVQWLGEVSTEEATTYSFNATNVGSVDVEYFARTAVYFNQPDDFLNQGFVAAKDAANARFAASTKGEGGDIDLQAHRDLVIKNASKRSVNRGEARSSNVPRMSPSREDLDIYFEDFEAGMLNESWSVMDFSFGLGSVFNVENYGSVDFPNHMLNVGDFNENGFYIFNDTYTMAFSETFSLADVPFSDEIILSFSYSFLLEQGWDFGSVWLGVEREDGIELFYAGSSEDIFWNDGSFNRISFNISDWAGEENVFMAFLVETDASVQSGWAAFDDLDVYTTENLAYVTPHEGIIDSGATQQLDVTLNAHWLFPGNYVAVTFMDYYGGGDDFFVARTAFQDTYFEIPNMKPVAEDDYIAAITDNVIPMNDIISYMLSNDFDMDGQVYLYQFFDPIHGDLKYTIDGWVYVAPNKGIEDYMDYVITDGQKMDTARVFISVGDEPHFPVGADKQFVFLEDEMLDMSTVGMAAGVGFWGDISVWGMSHQSDLMIAHNADENMISFSAADNAFGQYTATLYVGTDDGTAWDSMDVSIIVTPVNDAPTAEFSANVAGSTVTFADMSSDAIDMQAGGIVAWEWSFGDGTSSTDQNPTYDYGTTGDFTVTLTVTDNGGLTDTFEGNVNIMSVSNEVDGAVPTEFAIQQNYPNPFNPSTNINYSLPEASKVSIVVYDMLGQRIAELVNTEKSAGYHTVTFDASALSSGMYVYQIKAGAFSQTKKMMLIK